MWLVVNGLKTEKRLPLKVMTYSSLAWSLLGKQCLQWFGGVLMTGRLFHVYGSVHSEPTDKASALLHSLLLIESQACSLWLACVLAFKSLLIPTTLSAQIKYPLILYHRPFNWDFSHLACLSEHQRQHDLSKLEWSTFSFTLHPHIPTLPLVLHVCNTFSLHWSFVELLTLFSFIFMHSSSFLKALVFTRPSNYALLEASRWTPCCCIIWESNCVHKHLGVAGCGQLSGSDIINTQGKWQKSVLVRNTHARTHRYSNMDIHTYLPTCDLYKLKVCIDWSVCECYVFLV